MASFDKAGALLVPLGIFRKTTMIRTRTIAAKAMKKPIIMDVIIFFLGDGWDASVVLTAAWITYAGGCVSATGCNTTCCPQL